MQKRRSGGPRSRTGCITCKIRHIKCDEGKPKCLQCQKSGHRCDGYDRASQSQIRQRITTRQPSRTMAIMSADHRIVLRPETRTERRYVDHFLAQTSHALAGFFDSKLWTYFIPQLSEREPSIRHAIAAVGAAHWSAHMHSTMETKTTEGRPLASRVDSNSMGEVEPFILQEYNMAIRYLLGGDLTSPDSTLMAACCCCLFISLELLNKNKAQALGHIEGGLRMIARSQSTMEALQTSNPSTNELFEQVRDMFARLNVQASFFGRGVYVLEFPPWEVTRPRAAFNNLWQARARLDQIMNKALVFIRTVGVTREVRDPSLQLRFELEQQKAKEELQDWLISLDKTIEKRGRYLLPPSELRASLYLRIYYHISLVWTLTVLARDEMYVDHFISDLEAVVRYSEEVLRLNSILDKDNSSFTLEGEIIGPLYFAILRCRHPQIRRRGLNILKHYSKREGFWIAQHYRAVAQFVVEMEESQCPAPVESEKDIEDRFRIYLLYQSDLDACPSTVYIYTKPHGVDGEWRLGSALIDWKNDNF